MDHLVESGIRFDQAYCGNPICVPSRTSMITGLHSHQTGITYNVDDAEFYGDSIGSLLKQGGYRTGYVGKWHIPRSTEDADWHGFDFMAESDRVFQDEKVSEVCLAFLRQPSTKPYFLVASYNNPHDICEWARKLDGGFEGEAIDLWNGLILDPPSSRKCPDVPVNFSIEPHEPAIVRKHKRSMRGTYPSENWTEERWRQYLWGYDRLVELVDREMAKLLEALSGVDNARRTVIIFTSDHGDGRASHQWNQKTLHYEETAKVPLILVDPELKASQVCSQLAQTATDVFATIADYAEVPLSDCHDGLSLRDLYLGEVDRDAIFSQTDLHSKYGQSDGVYGRMCRFRNYKYIVYSHGDAREQLFDLDLDPGEMNNLAFDSSSLRELYEARQRMQNWCERQRDFFLPYCVGLEEALPMNF